MLKVRPIQLEDAGTLSRWFSAQSFSYRQYFQPFPDESESGFRKILTTAKKDYYRVVTFKEEWVGFYMLRGWDAGYERPSFGLLVDERHQGKGIGTLCLRAAMTECRLMGVSSCMLKVADENRAARAIYEKAGFRFESVCPNTGDDMLTIRWES